MNQTRIQTFLLAMIGALLVGCSGTGAARRAQHEALRAELGQDPVAMLSAIGTADPNRAGEMAGELREALTGQQLLRLMRFGLGHDSEAVVFGAGVLHCRAELAVPELANAAAVVAPRLGEPDCPIDPTDAQYFVGSGDFASLLPAIRRVPSAVAVPMLGALHRQMRPDAVPAMCELARTSDGDVQRAAFSNAELTVEYSDEQVPLLTRTWLACVGHEVREEDRSPGLPPLVRAAIRACLELSKGETGAEPQVGPASLPLPIVRWLLRSEPGVSDVPLLEALMTESEESLAEAAAWTLGARRHADARGILDGPRPAKVRALFWTAARARQGSHEALEGLFEKRDINELIYALAIALPSRRAQFFDSLLALPREQAVQTVQKLGMWPRKEAWAGLCDPAYDDVYFDGLEALLAAAPELHPRVLAEFIAALPCCETGRLADRLLSHPAADVLDDPAADPFGWNPGYENDDHPGHHGVWAFLEVTRPDQFRAWLRDGVSSGAPAVRKRCCELLVALGEHEPMAELVDWVDTSIDDLGYSADQRWLSLASSRAPSVAAVLRQRAEHAADDAEEAWKWMPPLAVACGMPVDVAKYWVVGDWPANAEARRKVLDLLLRGDGAGAFLRSRDPDDFWGVSYVDLACWADPRIRRYLEQQRDTATISATQALHIDMALALADDDRDALTEWMGPVRDGRYATHYGFPEGLAARAGGIAKLEFWIDQLGTNCCKCVFIEEVFQDLFGCVSEAFSWSSHREPAARYLRRTLLPVADRLRWSRIAGAYVVAGG